MARRLFSPLLLWLLTAGAAAWGQVSSELVAEKQIPQPGGAVRTVPASEVRPGDVVVYTATYRNIGAKPARALVATVPVPAGMEWQGATAGDKPAPSEASLDGKNFSRIPLTRKVKAASGQELVRDVPLSEYRFLRWHLAELGAGANVSVKLAAKVSTNP